MKAANRAKLCLPLPPTPTSSAFPRGDSRIRFIWQLHVEVQTVSCRKKCARDKESDSWNQKQCILSISFLSSLYRVTLSFRYSCKNSYQTWADTKSIESVNSVRFFSFEAKFRSSYFFIWTLPYHFAKWCLITGMSHIYLTTFIFLSIYGALAPLFINIWSTFLR